MIAERQRLVADDLSDLVTLAGDQQRVARLQRRDAGANGLGTVADLARTFSSSQNGAANRCQTWIGLPF